MDLHIAVIEAQACGTVGYNPNSLSNTKLGIFNAKLVPRPIFLFKLKHLI